MWGGWSAGGRQEVVRVGRVRERSGARAHAEHVRREERLVLTLLLLARRLWRRRPFRISRGNVTAASA
jgi:hypothetical protein